MSHIARQDLKKNELEDVVLRAAEWIKQHRTGFLSALGTTVGVIVLATFVGWRYHALQLSAQNKLAMAQGQLFAGQINDGVKMLDDLIRQHSLSAATEEARLLKSEYLVSQKKYDEAAQTLLPVVNNPKPKTIGPIALANLGAIREDAGKYPEALQSYNDFLKKYPAHFLAPRIHMAVGRVQEVSGAATQAKETYDKIVKMYPVTAWAQQAQERIAAIDDATAKAQPKKK